jgi:hypothetical protein
MQRNFLAKTLRILVLVTQKFVIKLSKIWGWDPEKDLFRIPDPGSKRQRILDWIRNTAFNKI